MKTRRLLKGAMLTALLLTGTAGFYSCSQDEGTLPDDGSRVAVQFTSQMVGGGTAVQTSASQMRNSAQSRTAGTEAQRGTTASGIAYTDFLAADGFETRAFTLPTADNASGGILRSGSDVLQTRTTTGGTQWATDDKVGIFMLSAPGTLSTSIVGGANNIQYNTKAAGASAALSPANTAQTIYYPSSGNVDFIAYYPYRTTPGTNPYIYKVNVATQSTAATQAAVDVLYSKKTSVSKSSTAVALAFNHALSKIVINVKEGTGMASADFSAMSVSLTGFPTTANLALSDGTTFDSPGGTATTITPLKWGAASIPAQCVATYEAIVIPQTLSTTSRKVVFTVGGAPYTWTIGDAVAFVQGKIHTYDITVNSTGIMVGSPTITLWTETTAAPTPGTAEVFAVKIKAGTFLMGSLATEPNRGSNETQHQVTLTKDFYMSKYQITNAQYAAFLNAKSALLQFGSTTGTYNFNNAGYFVVTEPLVLDCTTDSRRAWGVKRDGGTWASVPGYENHPVIYVTWFGAKAFADWVGGTLPTEAQWEYACRAGTTTAYSYGDIADAAYMWYSGSSQTQIVGTKNVNPWGLYDMHGNVFEWCSDRYAANYGSTNAGDSATDPTGPTLGSFRVLRGGSWSIFAQFCRSACRDNDYPADASDIFGFRVVFPL